MAYTLIRVIECTFGRMRAAAGVRYTSTAAHEGGFLSANWAETAVKDIENLKGSAASTELVVILM